MANRAPNPYVGPRAFEEGDHMLFFGREEETRQLASLVIARSAVLLYAPSGAGKTSLLKAGLIPYLQERKKLILLPVTRVGGDLPREVDGASVDNIYVFNALLNLVSQAAEPDAPVDPSLIGMSLKAGLKHHFLPRPDGDRERIPPHLLILDQFEELFTTHPGRYEDRDDFFSQLQDCLIAYPQLGLLLSMREDFIARLDPYAAQLPDRLRARFRLELLGEEAARLAIQGPARQAGVEFSDAAAQQLVNNLRKVRVQRPDGSTEEQPGQSVEPVQLQVVCHRLWEKLPPDAAEIEKEDLEKVGDVDTALADYFDERVTAIATESGTREWAIRDWFGEQLITEYGLRGQVLREPGQSRGLNNQVIQSLVDARLVRAERRRGATWYEPIHDRLIKPIQESNRAWKRWKILQWAKLGAAAILIVLVAMIVLTAVQSWRASSREQSALSSQLVSQAAANRDTQLDLALLLSLEAFQIDDSWETRTGLLVGLNHNPYLTTFLRTSTVGTSVLPVLATAYSPDGRTVTSVCADGRIIRWDVDTRQSTSDSSISAGTGLSSAAFSPDGQKLATGDADGTITFWDVATGYPFVSPSALYTQTVTSVAFSSDGQTLASTGAGGRLVLLDIDTRQIISQTTTGFASGVGGLAFSPDGQTLAVGGCGGFDEESETRPCIRGEIRLWNARNLAQSGRPLTGHNDRVTSLAFSPDGQTLASGSADRTLIAWDVASRRPLGEPLAGHQAAVHGLAYSPDGHALASGGDEGTLILWDVTTRQRTGAALTAHTDDVYSVAYSPDGQTLASASGDETVILWDVASRQPLGQPLTGHRGKVWSVAISPDGQTLASGSQDGTIILWDIAAHQPISEPFRGHKSDVYSLAFSPDGRTLASGSKDNTVILWDVASRQPISAPLTGHTESVLGVAFSPNGQTLASGSVDHTIILWNVATHQPIGAPLTGHTDNVRAVAFSPNGQILASGGFEKNVILWDIATRQALGEPLTGHRDKVFSLAFSPDGRTLASGSSDRTIMRWDVGTRQPLGEPLMGHDGAIYGLAFSPDGQTLASGSADSNVIMWEAPTRELGGRSLGQPLVGHAASVRSLAFSPDGYILAAGDYAETVILWDMQTRRQLGTPLTGHPNNLRSVAFSPDGHILAAGSVDGTIFLWDITTGQRLGVLADTESELWSVAFSPDGQLLASSTDDGRIIMWNPNTGEQIDILTGHTDSVVSLTFSPDGRLLASGSRILGGEESEALRPIGGEILLWDVQTLQPSGDPLIGHTGYVHSLAFSPDSRTLASGSADGTIILWDVRTHRPLAEPLGRHGSTVYSVAFSPDGRTLASGGSDRTILLWDVEARQPLGQPLVGHRSAVWSVAFSPDGLTLASGSPDNTIILWDVNPKSWQEIACHIANRNLTPAEWAKFIGRDTPYTRTCPDLPQGQDTSPSVRQMQ